MVRFMINLLCRSRFTANSFVKIFIKQTVDKCSVLQNVLEAGMEVLAVTPQEATGQNFWAIKKNDEQKEWEFTVLTDTIMQQQWMFSN